MKESTDISNKRIAKNTIYLYIRMLIVMGVSIYTSRVILSSLGVIDYGLYNVVGGIVGMIGVLNGALSSSTSRFLTYELGKGNSKTLNLTFSASLNLHIVVALIVLILAETVGLWFFYNKMVIPSDRMNAAFWVYQFSIITSMFSFTQVPYNASLIAHENMSIYAIVGLYDAVSKLLIAYLIQISPIDNLIFYGFLLMMNMIIVQLFYRFYSYNRYTECRFRLFWNKSIYKRQVSYSGWELFGGMAGICQGQGINILLNIFFGPTVNAARAIAYQIQNAVNMFINNFLMAVRPQVIKNYALGDYEQMYVLTFKSAKYSFYLMLALILPICYELRFILDLWLGNKYPEETYIFTLIVLIFGLSEIFHLALIMPFHAIGKMKLGNSLNGTIMVLALPVSYLVLKLGCPTYSVFVVLIITNLIVTFNGWFIVHSYVKFSIIIFLRDTLFYCILVGCTSIITPTFISYCMNDGWARFFILSIMTELALLFFVYTIGLKKSERQILHYAIKAKLLKKK